MIQLAYTEALILEWFGLQGTFRITWFQIPCRGLRLLPPDQVVPSPVHGNFQGSQFLTANTRAQSSLEQSSPWEQTLLKSQRRQQKAQAWSGQKPTQSISQWCSAGLGLPGQRPLSCTQGCWLRLRPMWVAVHGPSHPQFPDLSRCPSLN